MFSKQFSPVTGREEWWELEEDYDSRRDVARSTYGDMLHDSQRNKQYYKAVKTEVKKLTDKGSILYGLDIGTGTGLLAMMAASSGVNNITACEAFLPVAKVAKKIIEANDLADVITVVSKSSMETSVPKDMPEKADFVVMELFDTELIGEGLLPSMRHAHQHLLKKSATVVPAAATIYIQILQSQILWEMHQLSSDIPDKTGSSFNIPAAMVNCRGAPAVFDVQADEIRSDSFNQLTKPLPVLKFLFCELELNKEKKADGVNKETPKDGYKTDQVLKYLSEVVIDHSGRAHVILMWWDLQMDKDGEILLSMAPKWIDSEKAKRDEWRDHWMQGIYFLEKPIEVKKGQTLTVQTTHDDYSFWFDVHPTGSVQEPASLRSRVPLCTCGFHTVWSRARFAMVNDHKRRKKFQALSRKLVKNGVRVGLVISDGSLFGIIAAMAGFEKVYVLEPESASRRIIKQLVDANFLSEKVIFLPKKADELTKEDIREPIDAILGEPFFLSSLVPWHDLYFWYASRTVLSLFTNLGIKVFPGSACLKALAVQLKDLWKIKASLGTVEGFNVQSFDELIESCSVQNEIAEAEPHSMWEYPCRALTDIVDLLPFNFYLDIPEEKQQATGFVDFTREGFCNAVILWVDYMLDENTTMSTGVDEKLDLASDGYVKNWVNFCKQGVYFLRTPCDVRAAGITNTKLQYMVTFQPTNGSLTMNFDCLVKERCKWTQMKKHVGR